MDATHRPRDLSVAFVYVSGLIKCGYIVSRHSNDRVGCASIFRYLSFKYKSRNARKRETDRVFSFARVMQSRRVGNHLRQNKRKRRASLCVLCPMIATFDHTLSASKITLDHNQMETDMQRTFSYFRVSHVHVHFVSLQIISETSNILYWRNVWLHLWNNTVLNKQIIARRLYFEEIQKFYSPQTSCMQIQILVI